MVLNYDKPYELNEALIILPQARKIKMPFKVNFKEPVDLIDVVMELENYANILSNLGVNVKLMKCPYKRLPNVMFASDNVLSHGGIIYLPAMAGIRKEEPKWLYRRLENSVLLPESVNFESSDLLVLDEVLLLGIKNRTSTAIIETLMELYPKREIKFIEVPDGIQHLMGVVRPLGPDRVMVREKLLTQTDIDVLSSCYETVVKIPETNEIREKLAFNFVPIKENEVIIPDDVPAFEEFLNNFKVKTHKTSITNLRKADGGLACATGRLA